MESECKKKKRKRLIRESCTSNTDEYRYTNTRVLLDNSHLLGLELAAEGGESVQEEKKKAVDKKVSARRKKERG